MIVNCSEPNYTLDFSSRSVNEIVNGSHNFAIRGYSLANGIGLERKNPKDTSLYVSVFIGPTRANKTNFDASTSFPPSPSPLVTSTLTSLHLPDTFIQKIKKLYQDTRTQRNMAKLNDELYEVHQIMTHNIQEVLGVGEKLNQVSQMSSRLTSESCIYADKAKDLNHQALIQKWSPVALVLGVVFLLFWVKNKLCDAVFFHLSPAKSVMGITACYLHLFFTYNKHTLNQYISIIPMHRYWNLLI